jgi:hypothetical protein
MGMTVLVLTPFAVCYDARVRYVQLIQWNDVTDGVLVWGLL